jgi:putative transposase
MVMFATIRNMSSIILSLIDSIAVLLSQGYQLARIRLASTASPVMRLICQRDHAVTGREHLKRELAILRASRRSMPPHKRPEYPARQRLAILQLKRHRGWSNAKTAKQFVIHPNTLRSWIRAAEGRGRLSLLEDAIRWNRIDDVVRWASHELRRLCPEREFGTRTLARHLVRAGVAISRSTVQRVLREEKPKRPRRPRRSPMAEAAGVEPHHLLKPAHRNHIWHLDLTCIRILWFRFTIAGILDGFSRRLLALKLFVKVPRQIDAARLVRSSIKKFGKPDFLITDHGTQFRTLFHQKMQAADIHHVKGRVRTPYLNGKMERAFQTFKLWWRAILCGLSQSSIQNRLDTYRHWYNHHRPHSAINGLTPDEAWNAIALTETISIRCRDPVKPAIHIRRVHCRGDPQLPVIQITLSKAA